jgi:hypothetical protein
MFSYVLSCGSLLLLRIMSSYALSCGSLLLLRVLTVPNRSCALHVIIFASISSIWFLTVSVAFSFMLAYFAIFANSLHMLAYLIVVSDCDALLITTFSFLP